MKTAILCLALFATFYSAQGGCTYCGYSCSEKDWTQLNYYRQDGWKVKLIGPPPSDASVALKRYPAPDAKAYLGDSDALVLTYDAYFCVRMIQFQVSCNFAAEVRLMDVDSGKDVVATTYPMPGSEGWTQYYVYGPCCANRIKIRVWAADKLDPNCKPQPLTAIRNVGVEYCEDGCVPDY